MTGLLRRAAAVALALLALAGAAAAAEEPRRPTGDVPILALETDAGIGQTYTGPWEFFVGGGAGSFDCDADGRPDLMIAGGRGDLGLFVNRSEVGGALRFEARDTGLSDRDRRDVLGVHPVEIDGDGHVDVALVRLGRNLLLKGGPDCTFEVANRLWNFDGGRAWSTAFAATWEKGARFPTLAFGNYVDRAQPGSPWGTCHDNDLHRPAPGRDVPDYGERIALSPGYCALSILFTDWNRSGEPSLRVANDRQYYRGGEEQLWKVPPGRPPALYDRSDGWQHLTIWGMGIAQFDLDADGAPEYAITSMGDNKLQVLDEEADETLPIYRDVAFEKGVTAHRPYTGDEIRPSTAWHAEFADFNNDAAIDLFIAKGNVEAMPDFASFDPSNLLLGRFDGTFAEAGQDAGIATGAKGRGAVVDDFNLDGMPDLLQVNRGGPVSLFRNMGVRVGETAYGPMGNFLKIRLEERSRPATTSNRWAVGARISVKTGTRVLPRDVLVGGGHASGRVGWTHVGLGTAERAEIRVQWPDGEWSHAYRVFANQHVVIRRDQPEAFYWYPAD